MGKGPLECEHTGFKSPRAADGVTDDGALNDIHDKPDIVIDALDLDVSFIGGKGIGGLVVVIESELGDDSGGGVNIPCNHAMRYGNAVDIKHDPLCLPERQAAVHHIGQAKAEDVRRKLAEVEIHGFPGDRGKIHFEKVSGKFSIDVMEFEPVRIRVIFRTIFRRKRSKRVFVEFAVLADTLMDEKSLAVFHPCKGVATVRALQEKRYR